MVKKTSTSAAFASFFKFLHGSEADSRSAPPTDRIFNNVLNQILLGKLLPGNRINEFELARTMNINNDRVREAMERLIYLGMVERIPNRGIRVREISPAELDDIYQAREMIELETIRKLAPVITDEQLAKLREVSQWVLADVLYREKLPALDATDPDTLREAFYADKNVSRNTKADIQFHMLLMQFLGNRIWEEMGLFVISRLIMCFQVPLFLLPPTLFKMAKQHERNAVEQQGLRYISHEEIFKALAARDARQAEHLLGLHLKVCYCGNKARIDFFKELDQTHKIQNVGA